MLIVNVNTCAINLDNTYINVSISDDIDIEEGYTYLIYLKKNQEKYEIIGLDVGLRKVNVNYSSRLRTQNLDIDTLEVMNNKTGEFESLQNYLFDTRNFKKILFNCGEMG